MPPQLLLSPPHPAAPPEGCSPFAARPPSPVPAENGTPDSLSAGLLSWKWQNFSVLLSYCHLSILHLSVQVR